MDKSCRSFFFWTFCSRERTLAWLLAIVAVTLSRPLKNNRRPAKLSGQTHTHTSLSPLLRLIKCDHSYSRDPLRKPTEKQVIPSIFPKKTDTHSSKNTLIQSFYLMASVLECVSVCVCVSMRYRSEFSVAYGNVLPPTILHLFPWYHSPPSLWSASRWHSCLASFITAPWWMRRPHLHNTSGAWDVGTKGNHKNSGRPPELCVTFLFGVITTHLQFKVLLKCV